MAEYLARSARRILGADAVTGLCVFTFVLLALPSSLVYAPLGSAGAPATLIGLVGLLWWSWHHLHRPFPQDVGIQPVRWMALLLLVLVAISYVVSMASPIPVDEVSPSDSSILRLLSLVGLTLVANDGIRSTKRMDVLLRFLVFAAAAIAALSIFQFITGQLWVDRISLPGLTASSSISLDARQGITRPSGTATSPIEFAAVISMVLPIAIMDAKSHRRFQWTHLAALSCILLGVFLSISRTAILCVAIGLLIIMPALPRLWRILGAIGTVIIAGVLYLTVPGLIGTIRGLFSGLQQDPSVQSRTDAYAVAFEFIARSPWIGRGLGTFLPRYWILDNMYLQMIIEIGVLGFAALLGLFLSGALAARRASRLFPPGRERDLATGVSAGIVAGATSFAFFDALSFPQAAFGLFMLVGIGGACYRLARSALRDDPGRVTLPSAPLPEPTRRRPA